jgi:hypothetical protein
MHPDGEARLRIGVEKKITIRLDRDEREDK